MKMDSSIKVITIILTIAGLAFTIYEFTESKRIESAKPYLMKKLALCSEAVETTSYIAIIDVESKPKIQRFWQLYFGLMGLVEDGKISGAMVAFGKGLQTKSDLKRLSLDLAHACRSELSKDWSPNWGFNN